MRMRLKKLSDALSTVIRKYLVAGLLALIPVWVTYLVFNFLVGLLAQYGAPAVDQLGSLVRPYWPGIADWLALDWFRSLLGVVLILVAVAMLGWITTLVVGRELVELFDRIVNRIPVVKRVYGAVKQLMDALQRRPDGVQRVVLIEFPSPEMKAVGLVTRTFADADTGRKLAAVYVPTTPNPTSGYLEIVPLEKVTSTDWTVDEAMNFIMSGGAVTPDKINYERSAFPEEQLDVPADAAQREASTGPPEGG